MSGIFALLGAALAYRLYLQRDKTCFMWALFAFYAGMEFLQFLQHRTLNQCNSKENQFLTIVAFLYILVQPFLWNYFAFRCRAPTPFLKGVFSVSMVLCVLVAGSMGTRWGTGTDSKGTEFMTGELCTKRDKGHLYWQWPIGLSNTHTANWFAFMLVWMAPLIFFGQRSIGTSLAAGALLSYAISKNSAEFPSAWCLMSLPLLIGGFALDLHAGKVTI